MASSSVSSQSEKPWLAPRGAVRTGTEPEEPGFKPGLEGDEPAVETASMATGAGGGAGTDAGTGASADAGMGADGSWLSEGKICCARRTPARAQSARMKTHIRPAKEIRLHEWEEQLMGITTIEEGNGGGPLLFLYY